MLQAQKGYLSFLPRLSSYSWLHSAPASSGINFLKVVQQLSMKSAPLKHLKLSMELSKLEAYGVGRVFILAEAIAWASVVLHCCLTLFFTASMACCCNDSNHMAEPLKSAEHVVEGKISGISHVLDPGDKGLLALKE
jgi:hypothetical protein